jgi:hypothetical protein
MTAVNFMSSPIVSGIQDTMTLNSVTSLTSLSPQDAGSQIAPTAPINNLSSSGGEALNLAAVTPDTDPISYISLRPPHDPNP